MYSLTFFIFQTAIGVPKPDWTKDYYPDKLLDLSIYHLAMNSKTDILKKLSGGPFIKKAIKTMQQKKKGTLKPPSRKMFAYVSHDSTLVNVMTAMGVWDGKDTDYNCMFMMELHENDGEWNVQVSQRKIKFDFFCYISSNSLKKKSTALNRKNIT